jgi:putative heme iron utilization protein
MSWVTAAEYTAAEPDPLRPHARRIVDHMNDDHADALVLFCRVLADRPGTARARMVGVDRYGFAVLAADGPDADEVAVRLRFDAPVDTPDAARAAMVELVRRARSAG